MSNSSRLDRGRSNEPGAVRDVQVAFPGRGTRITIIMATREDALVAHAVSRKIAEDSAISLRARIHVTARDGVVTLEGSVLSRIEATRAVSAALRTARVREVCDHLRVGYASVAAFPERDDPLRASTATRRQELHGPKERGDAEILAEIMTRIRTCGALEAARLLVYVEGGRVTMKGEVGNAEQRLAARSLVWVAGVRVVIDAVAVRKQSGDRFVAR